MRYEPVIKKKLHSTPILNSFLKFIGLGCGVCRISWLRLSPLWQIDFLSRFRRNPMRKWEGDKEGWGDVIPKDRCIADDAISVGKANFECEDAFESSWKLSS